MSLNTNFFSGITWYIVIFLSLEKGTLFVELMVSPIYRTNVLLASSPRRPSTPSSPSSSRSEVFVPLRMRTQYPCLELGLLENCVRQRALQFSKCYIKCEYQWQQFSVLLRMLEISVKY
jgi:hypothetical protein